MNADALRLLDDPRHPLSAEWLGGAALRHAAGEGLPAGSAGDGLLIVSGLVCAFTAAHRPRAVPLGLLGPGDLLGEQSPLRAGGEPLHLQAVTEVHCRPLRPLGPGTSPVFQALGRRTAQKLVAQADWRLAGTAFERVAQTLRLLAAWALDEAPRAAQPAQSVKLALSTTALAGLCGLSRRHTAEALLPLQAAGWLRAQRSGLLLRWPWAWQDLGPAPRLDSAEALLALLDARLQAQQRQLRSGP